MLKKLRLLLLPFSLLYWVVTAYRNLLFNFGYYHSHSYNVPVIGVGNLTVGGTGKTPHLEYILRILQKEGINTAVLSRGYKRQSKGFVLCKPNTRVEEIGDEPMQIAQKFPFAKVAVCEKRNEGIRKMQTLFSEIETFVLDDSFQHRYVSPSMQILMVDYNRPIWKDFVFPAGMMREGFYARHRAEVIIVSKCPAGLSEDDRTVIIQKLALKPGKKLFFTTTEYAAPKFIQKGQTLLQDKPPAIIVTGIAQHKAFAQFVNREYNIEKEYHYPDHHYFTDNELETILNEAKTNGSYIITTEKDSTRIIGREALNRFSTVPILYYPIQPKVLFGQEQAFHQMLMEHIKHF